MLFYDLYFFPSKLTDIHHAAERTQTICILSVPATMTCHDLLRFTAPCHQDVRHFRILRDGSPNQYMALITFKSAVIMRKLIFYE